MPSILSGAFGIAVYVLYLIIGFVQMFAIMDGLSYALGIGKVLSFFIAIFLTYIPLVGSCFGVYGAVEVWDWHLYQAILLFFWYAIIATFAFILTISIRILEKGVKT